MLYSLGTYGYLLTAEVTKILFICIFNVSFGYFVVTSYTSQCISFKIYLWYFLVFEIKFLILKLHSFRLKFTMAKKCRFLILSYKNHCVCVCVFHCGFWKLGYRRSGMYSYWYLCFIVEMSCIPIMLGTIQIGCMLHTELH